MQFLHTNAGLMDTHTSTHAHVQTQIHAWNHISTHTHTQTDTHTPNSPPTTHNTHTLLYDACQFGIELRALDNPACTVIALFINLIIIRLGM